MIGLRRRTGSYCRPGFKCNLRSPRIDRRPRVGKLDGQFQGFVADPDCRDLSDFPTARHLPDSLIPDGFVGCSGAGHQPAQLGRHLVGDSGDRDSLGLIAQTFGHRWVVVGGGPGLRAGAHVDLQIEHRIARWRSMGQHANTKFTKLLLDREAELGGVDLAGAVNAHIGRHRRLPAQGAIVRRGRVENDALRG